MNHNMNNSLLSQTDAVIEEGNGFDVPATTGSAVSTTVAPLLEAQIQSQQAAREAGAPTLADVFGKSGGRHSLELFSQEEIQSIENALVRKSNRLLVKCFVTDKERLAKPEEIVRQLWLHRLLYHYSYPKNRISIEYPITFGRDSSKRADIVVLDADRTTAPYIIIEVKAIKLKDGKDQLKSYCHGTGAPIGVWSNGGQVSIYHRRDPNYFSELPALPGATETIEDVVNQPWTLETLEKKARLRERDKPLKDIILEMENEVLANSGVDVFEEVFKLIFTKLFDEISVYRGKHKHLRFRNTNTESDVRVKINDLFDHARREWEGVFPADDRIKLTGSHLVICVSYLEEYKLFNSNLDVIDEAFEYLINQTSKGEKGQYFTPRWVIDMCVKMLNPQEHETLIDTACGSAGFTVHSIFKVWHDIMKSEGVQASHLFTMEKKPPRCYEYVREKVFAIDFDEKAVRVARCLNLIAGDGQTNVLHLNTLDFRRWDEWVKGEEWQDTYFEGWKRLKRLASTKNNYRKFKFDVLMANPPFAGDIRQSDMLASYDLAHKSNGKPESKVGRDLLFIERNLDFLRPGGRMAVVLPQGRFNNSTDKRLREFIADRCRILAVVGLEPNTFKPHTGTKTSVLFVQKWNNDPTLGPICKRVDDYPIFFSTQKLPAKDNSGEKLIARKDGHFLQDTHGHWVVQHDLFNHEGLTQDGIAEAFQEFAAREGLSFF
jgi:type I restriction enzyme M protein